MYDKESVSLTDIKKYPEIYDKLKENNLIKNSSVRFIK
jgi:hypothetical protein